MARADGAHEPIEDLARQHLGGRVLAAERRILIKIPVIELLKNCSKLFASAADVNNHAIGIQIDASKRRVNDKCRAVQTLRGPERGATEAMGNHEVIANGHAVHRISSIAIMLSN